MPKPTVLSSSEAKAFLTAADLQKLTRLLIDGKLIVDIVPNKAPTIEVRGSLVQYFDVISLLGSV